ncbi:MAG: molybdopterin-dependent oxidoreductase [Verrucomicrobiota bacterium]
MSDSNGSEIPLIDVQIDGEWHKVPKGMRMIEAVRMARGDGTTVPHYCYHPKLSSPGNCRMCLVEMGMPPRPRPGEEPELDEDGHAKIGWMPRPAIACANTVAPGMGIRTESMMAQECRRGVMEFLLINHPLDCPICDQAGECSLQEFSVEHGNGDSRFLEQKVKKPKNVEIGPRIRLDDERCILCSRCVRFSKEVADDDVLGFVDRGSYNVLTTHPGKKLANNYSLNTVDICPVGALTSNDFRFQMRVWFLKETKSIDVNCGTGANIVIHSREGKVYRITPRENNEVNSSWMPDSHRLNFHYLESEARLTEPLIKENATHHRPVDWPEAVRRAADGLLQYKGNGLAIVASARMTNEELFLVNKLANFLEPDHIDVVPRSGEADDYLVSADRNPNTNGAKVLLNITEPGSQLEKIREGINDNSIKALLVFGEDLIDAGFTESQLKKLDSLVVTNILANPTAEHADVVLPTAGFAEKRGSMINVAGRLQRLNKAVEPPGLAMDDWEMLRELLLSIAGSNGIYLIEDVFKEMSKKVEIFEGLSLGKIGDLGVQVLETGVGIPLLEREREKAKRGEIFIG